MFHFLIKQLVPIRSDMKLSRAFMYLFYVTCQQRYYKFVHLCMQQRERIYAHLHTCVACEDILSLSETALVHCTVVNAFHVLCSRWNLRPRVIEGLNKYRCGYR
jgi:hypothetical protein